MSLPQRSRRRRRLRGHLEQWASAECCSARRPDADLRGNVLIPLDSEGSNEDAEQHPRSGLPRQPRVASANLGRVYIDVGGPTRLR